MIFGRKKPDDNSGGGTQDPVGKNPTENPRRSSAGKRRQKDSKLDKDLGGTKWGKKDKGK